MLPRPTVPFRNGVAALLAFLVAGCSSAKTFVVLLPDITDDEANSVARRIISRVSEPFEFAPAARIGVSIGIAAAPRDGTSPDELLSAADRAMYEAKDRGKGGFVIHAPTVETASLAPSMEAIGEFCRAAR